MKLTLIGAGNMGGSLAKGFVQSGALKAEDITCADRSEQTLSSFAKEGYNVNITQDNKAAVKGADIVIFAVKPWILENAVAEVKDCLDYTKQTIISIAAGKGLDELDRIFNKDGKTPELFYLIPNIAVEVGSGMFFYCTKNASQKSIDTVQDLFSQMGYAMHTEERLMSAGTALSSCGIAYVFRYIRAQVEGGVEMGFYPKDAQRIVLQTMKGAVDLMLAHNSHPEQEVDKVTTPGGITIKGLNAMEEAGFTNAVIKGLKAGK
ncbi:MAG: pyrroline-5-carboxylate reductase [Bacteroidaceae bacterium]|nr:pyrroline-5-carboxylate reductase [Bacteroidaceae bacterium]